MSECQSLSVALYSFNTLPALVLWENLIGLHVDDLKYTKIMDPLKKNI